MNLSFDFSYACMPHGNRSGGWDVIVLDDEGRISDTHTFDNFWDAMTFRRSINEAIL
jgi:hypothetical protein